MPNAVPESANGETLYPVIVSDVWMSIYDVGVLASASECGLDRSAGTIVHVSESERESESGSESVCRHVGERPGPRVPVLVAWFHVCWRHVRSEPLSKLLRRKSQSERLARRLTVSRKTRSVSLSSVLRRGRKDRSVPLSR